MTQVDPLEERLRRTFDAVASRPVAPSRFDAGAKIPAPAPAGGHRTARAWTVGAVAAIVVLGLVLAVVYGPRSTTPGSHPGTLSAQPVRGVFAPVSVSTPVQLRDAARTMTARLHALGHRAVAVTVSGGRLEVRGSSISAADLAVAASTGTFMVRPALCGAPDAAPGADKVPASSGLLPACAAPYQITVANLGYTAGSGGGFTTRTVPPDPALSSYASTPVADDVPGATVLLPASLATVGSDGDARYVLGPAELDRTAIAGATASAYDGLWTVTLSLTTQGAAQWDTAASENFHAMLGIDLDGQVISAALIEPMNTSFVSFDGQLQISGNFTADEAQGIAAVLGTGPLPVALAPSNQASGQG